MSSNFSLWWNKVEEEISDDFTQSRLVELVCAHVRMHTMLRHDIKRISYYGKLSIKISKKNQTNKTMILVWH